MRFVARQATRPVLTFQRKPSLFGVLLRNYLKRPEWLYYPGVDLDPIKCFTFLPRLQPGPAQLQLCKRLIAAYKLAGAESPATQSASELWKGIIQKHYQLLLSSLEKGEPEALGRILAGMFQEHFMWGISMGALGLDPGYAPFIRMKMVEELLALAESVGVVRTETPEQGILGHGLEEGLPALVKKIERQIGMSIDFPRVGGAYGFEIDGVLITAESPEHIYVAVRINEAIARHVHTSRQKEIRIVEIGAGFGGTACWLSRLRNHQIGSYTIIDLPMVNVFQGYFLGSVFGPERVRFHGEDALGGGGIEIVPAHAKEKALQGEFHVLINENSMPEMPEPVVKDYLSWAKGKLTDIFYSYNQEAYSPVNNVPQTLVPKVAAEIGNYRRLSRNYSWIRRGYVEEVYAVER